MESLLRMRIENVEAMENREDTRRVRLARTHAHTFSNIIYVGAQKDEWQNED